MNAPLSVIGLISTFNEADVIEHVVRDFIEQGVEVYLLDDGSTDDTVARVQPMVGHGVRHIELLAPTGRGSSAERFEWSRILRRKEELAAALDADWFIHNDADEFRESPWADVTLREAIGRVDRLGYNAIDSLRLDFWPTHDDFVPGSDVRRTFTHYAPAEVHDRLQIRCWKKQRVPVDLVSSGGHEVKFDGRTVFPIRFLLRHYPIRGTAHGRRKVFDERQPRFVESERSRGWHIQYDRVPRDASFMRDPGSLTEFDAESVRLSLWIHSRDVDVLTEHVAALEATVARQRGDLEETGRALSEAHEQTAGIRAALAAATAQLAQAQTELAAERADLLRLQREASQVVARLEGILQSRSWRWTAWVRSALRGVAPND